MQREYGLHIGGHWQETPSTYQVRSPATQELLAQCAVATEADVDRAVRAAHQA
jgi:acyl-CoA reductase-like NAD-dependent aldehyde dehydrogenase